jgi:hypothetical protein
MDMTKSNWQVLTVLPTGTEISTVELPSYCLHPHSYPFETCVFVKNGSSRVVGQFKTKKEAITAHTFLVQHELYHELLESTVG